MRIKTLTLKLDSDILPHSKNEVDDYDIISEYLLQVFEDNVDYAEDIDINEPSLIFASILSSRMIEGIPESVVSYKLGKWGSKLYSGDVAGNIAEIITYALLHQRYSIPFDKIIPLRPVKYLGIITDGIVDISISKRLQEELDTNKGLLFINTRSSMIYNHSAMLRRISTSLKNLEVARYQDNYGLLSLVLRYSGEIYDYLVFVKP
ncbi:MAG: hypothetical protein OWQ54_06225 [Sulfolobaceae archaeon]|nr:hypothetical protein [Sulfolobaceae archaeon]